MLASFVRLCRWLRRLLVRTLLLVAAIAAGAIVWDVATYDAEAWRRDYAHLKHELAHRYANLDWLVDHRGLDLPAIDRETEAAILGAHSRVRAGLALRRFVHSFGDPHLRLVWGHREADPAPGGSGAGAAEPAILATLADAEYEVGDRSFRIPCHRLPGWIPVAGGPFPTGLAHDLGVLRIASFGEDRYRDIAAQVFVPGQTRRQLQIATRARLQQSLREAIADLRSRGARRLLVDVTGNGGGTEWVTEVVALFTDRELTRRSTRTLAPGRDRSGIFAGRRVPSALAPEAAPARLQGTGEWSGRLYVLVDSNTGSAAEDFVVWLKENGLAKVLGQRTAGAGGGYVDGGGWIRLSAAPFTVRAPNCARFLADGTNEIEGVTPDVELPIAGQSEDAFAAMLAAAVVD
jgi:hypothetical protein